MPSGPSLEHHLTLVETLHRSSRNVIWRARAAGSERLIVKRPATAIPSPQLAASYQIEMDRLQALQGPGVTEPLNRTLDTKMPQLIFEDAGLTPLSRLSDQPWTAPALAQLMLQLAQILGRVHRAGWLHHQIHPGHLLWNPAQQRLWLCDWSRCSSPHATCQPPETTQALRYAAPERSGRLMVEVDARSDLYGVGAVAWQLASATPPFVDLHDEASLVHAIIALELPSLEVLRPGFPPSLARIIARLLEKDPSRRYPSSQLLECDLRSFLEADDRPLGLTSIENLHWQAPTQVLGREQLRLRLQQGLATAAQGGSDHVWLWGPSGVGKSLLAYHLHGNLHGSAGMFLASPPQASANTPYAPMLAALRNGLAQLLSSSEDELKRARRRVSQEVTGYAPALIGLIPELAHLLPETRSLEVPPEESRHRLYRAVSALVRALSSCRSPLVILVDELKSDDSATRELIDFVARDPEQAGLLLIAACREDISGQGWEVSPFALADTQEWCALACPGTPWLEELAQLAHQKTAGNPLALQLLFDQLARQGSLQFDLRGGWSLALESLRGVAMPAQVAEQLARTISQLECGPLAALTTAACLGVEFRESDLAELLDSPAPPLELLKNQGFLESVEADGTTIWRFQHARIREAAESLLSAPQREEIHYRAGHLKGQSRLAHHRHCLARLHRQETLEFARAALEVAEQSRRAGAFEDVQRILSSAHSALGPQGWGQDYELMLALTTRLSEATLVLGRSEELAHLLDEMQREARSRVDEIPIWTTRLRWLLAAGRRHQAYELSDHFLRQFGRSQPRSSHPARILKELARTAWMLKGRGPQELLALPESHDPIVKGIQEVQTLAALAQARVAPDTIPLGILRDVQSLLQDGLTAHGAQCWTGYGYLLCVALGQIQSGTRFGELALAQVERLGRLDVWPRVACLAYSLIWPWSHPLTEAAQRCREASTRGFEVGDILSAFYAAAIADLFEFVSGLELSAALQQVKSTERSLIHYRQQELGLEQRTLRRAIERLVGQPSSEEAESESVSWTDNPHGRLLQRILNLQAALIFGRVGEAFELARRQDCDISTPTLGPLPLIYSTYAAIALVSGMRCGWIESRQLSAPLKKYRQVIVQWSRARKQRMWRWDWIEGLQLGQLERLDQALEGALAAGYRQDAALICQQASDIASMLGRERAAQMYQEQSLSLYRHWGAMAKVAELSPPSVASPMALDVSTVARSAEALAGAVGLDELLETILQLALESAGAQQAQLFLWEGTDWVWSASAGVGRDLVRPEVPFHLDEVRSDLPTSLLRYCARTRETVLAGEVAHGRFGDDPFCQANPHCSLVVLPLQQGGKLTGLLLLEHRQARGVFAPERVHMLQLLSAQMAISLENARTARAIEQERERRHQEELRNRDLAARKDALAAFLGIASHDLKSPLAAISMWTQQLPSDRHTEGALWNIQNACQRASGLISTYLDIVALEQGSPLRLQRTACALENLIENEIDFQLQLLPPQRRARTDLAWELEPIQADVDADRLRQVIGNLVANALTHCPEGCPIEVTLQQCPGGFRIEVRDQGPGLSRELQKGLFQPFERRSQLLQGSGLGLWICRRIVESHGGRIGLDSASGQGSTFWCEIPLIVQTDPELAPLPQLALDADETAVLFHDHFAKRQS